MPKANRHGQAEVWNADQFEQGMVELSPKMRSLFSICYFTGCRISAAPQLRAEDIVGNHIVFRQATTKTKRTRSVPIHPKLRAVLTATDLPKTGYLFPGRQPERLITRQAADKALRKACDRIGLRGFSTHSNRRTWATRLDRAGTRHRVIQKLGGWSQISALQRYLEVDEVEAESEIATL